MAAGSLIGRTEQAATLPDGDVEAIAIRVAELLVPQLAALLGERGAFPRDGLVDVDDVAAVLKMSRDWVYEHQAELGAVRLGAGARPPLRFDAARVREYMAAGRVDVRDEASPRRRGPRRTSRGVELLPLRGASA